MKSVIGNNKPSQQAYVAAGQKVPSVTSAKASSVAAPALALSGHAVTGTTQELEQQITQLNQANVVFQQQTDQRIDVLNQEHNSLQGKLTKLNDVLGMLNQEVNQLGQQITTAQKQISAPTTPGQKTTAVIPVMHDFTQQTATSNTTQYVLYAILALLLIIILMLVTRRSGFQMRAVAEPRSSSSAANDGRDTGDTEDEYDFMGSEEAIPAKLDLARAYVAMEDYKSARKVLEQIAKIGNKDQQTEAREMLLKIKN